MLSQGLDLVARGLFFVLLGIFTIYTLFLAYHWFTYGMSVRVSRVMLVVYLAGAALAFLVMALSLT